MTKIILSGCNGRMGQAICSIVKENPNAEIVAGFDINATAQNGFPVYSDWNEITEKADVIVDFSNPNVLKDLLSFAKSKKLAIVAATTGYSSSQTDEIHAAASVIPVFKSMNMSIGINLLIDLVRKAAEILGETFDIEIVERHHNQKVDAPSGTALMIADAISETMKTPCEYVYDRHSVRRKRGKNEIGIHTVRGGTIPGDHSVMFAGANEILEVNHHAASREVFASGAVHAAIFISSKPAGLYNMNNLIKGV